MQAKSLLIFVYGGDEESDLHHFREDSNRRTSKFGSWNKRGVFSSEASALVTEYPLVSLNESESFRFVNFARDERIRTESLTKSTF